MVNGETNARLIEDINLDQVTLVMKMEKESDENVIENVIVRLIRLKVITYNDLSDFSDELQNEVKRILEMSR